VGRSTVRGGGDGVGRQRRREEAAWCREAAVRGGGTRNFGSLRASPARTQKMPKSSPPLCLYRQGLETGDVTFRY
jgi:hypothetical protein